MFAKIHRFTSSAGAFISFLCAEGAIATSARCFRVALGVHMCDFLLLLFCTTYVDLRIYYILVSADCACFFCKLPTARHRGPFASMLHLSVNKCVYIEDYIYYVFSICRRAKHTKAKHQSAPIFILPCFDWFGNPGHLVQQ